MTISDFSYRIEGKAFRVVNRALRAHPTSAPYVSGDAFRALADHVMDMDSGVDPLAVGRGDVVFVATHELSRFASDILPRIRERFVLITHNSDANVDAAAAGLAGDERIVRWFAQNLVFRREKMIGIPIGLENRWRHNNGIVGDYRRLARGSARRRPRILYGFSVGTNAKEREPALAALKRACAADEYRWSNSRAYRRCLSEYCFVASPPGNGVDCHRTWEALYLGVVPIVKRSALYDGLPGLPMIAVEDWREIEGLDEARLADLYGRVHAAPEAIEPIWMDYWASAIEAARLEA